MLFVVGHLCAEAGTISSRPMGGEALAWSAAGLGLKPCCSWEKEQWPLFLEVWNRVGSGADGGDRVC